MAATCCRRVDIVLLASLAFVLASCGRVTQPRAGPSPSSPLSSATGDGVRFLLEDSYEVGQHVDVAIENVGGATYLYNQEYAACDLIYLDGAGREFLIPPGTHCDLIAMVEIGPGERKTLFRWDLDECVKDEWGCVKSEPLPPGDYTIRGSFKRKGGGDPARASATITIIAPASA